MSPDEKIDSVGGYRALRAVREGSVFAKYKIKKRQKKQQEQKEESPSSEKKSSEHKIDIEV